MRQKIIDAKNITASNANEVVTAPPPLTAPIRKISTGPAHNAISTSTSIQYAANRRNGVASSNSSISISSRIVHRSLIHQLMVYSTLESNRAPLLSGHRWNTTCSGVSVASNIVDARINLNGPGSNSSDNAITPNVKPRRLARR